MLETNELTRKLRTLLHPRAALIAYAREDNSHYVYDNSYFIEVRDIDESGIMGEGRPVTAEFMNELVRGYSQKLVFYFFCSNNFTVCGLFRIDTESSCTYFIQPVIYVSGRSAFPTGTSR